MSDDTHMLKRAETLSYWSDFIRNRDPSPEGQRIAERLGNTADNVLIRLRRKRNDRNER